MFTGIIEEVGTILQRVNTGGGIGLTVEASAISKEIHVNDSVAINGVCLTVVQKEDGRFTVEAVEETLAKTTLGRLTTNDTVNLELPLKFGDRLGGHLVLGHVDCVGNITSIHRQESSWLMTVAFPPEFSSYLIRVGSIAVDGISLTVARHTSGMFTVSLIPHTIKNTTLAVAKEGTAVNLEFDVLGKYVHSILKKESRHEGVSADKMREWGYLA